jgi:hypothetical protein
MQFDPRSNANEVVCTQIIELITCMDLQNANITRTIYHTHINTADINFLLESYPHSLLKVT